MSTTNLQGTLNSTKTTVKAAKATTTLKSSGGQASAQIFDGFQGTVVGLNVNKIAKMEEYLDEYIKAVTDTIKIWASENVIQTAVRGTNAQVEVKKYIKSVDANMEKLFTDLTKYKKILENMKASYAANDKFRSSGVYIAAAARK